MHVTDRFSSVSKTSSHKKTIFHDEQFVSYALLQGSNNITFQQVTNQLYLFRVYSDVHRTYR